MRTSIMPTPDIKTVVSIVAHRLQRRTNSRPIARQKSNDAAKSVFRTYDVAQHASCRKGSLNAFVSNTAPQSKCDCNTIRWPRPAAAPHPPHGAPGSADP